MLISDWSSAVCSSVLARHIFGASPCPAGTGSARNPGPDRSAKKDRQRGRSLVIWRLSAVDGQPLLVAACLHALGQQEGEFKRLVGIETRVAMGVVAVLQVEIGRA